MGFALSWTMFRLLVWGLIVVWIDPRVLNAIGGHDLAIWLQRHVWVRVLGVPPLGLLALISAFEVIDSPRRRAKLEELAQATGATVTSPPRMDPAHGLPSGPGLRVPIGRWSMTVARWKNRASPTTVARVELRGISGFSFAARDARSEPVLMRGLQQAAVRLAVNKLARRAGDAQTKAAVESLAMLATSPIPIGHDTLDRSVVLRSNRPELARALLTASAVAAAVEALGEGSRRWTWTLYSSGAGDAAEMQFECPGGLEDPESLRRVQDLLRAALEHLSEQGVLAA